MAVPDLYASVNHLVDPLSMSTGRMAPQGVTVHHLADVDVNRAIKSLRAEGLGYHIIIDRQGAIYQTTYFSHTVAHAGKALWNGLSPNRHHIAVALASWGAVTKKGDNFIAWNGSPLSEAEVARRPGNLSNSLYHWHIATAKQETQLLTFLRWCILKGISHKNICGHDEAALPAGRKSDPGGVLSKLMAEVRDEVSRKPGS